MGYKKIKVKIDWLKENLSIIILLPAIIGGLWQLIELSSISTAYIRFFSVTQVVSDGILVLFMLSLIYLSLKFVNLNHPLFKIVNLDSSKPSNWKYALKRLLNVIYLLSIVGVVTYFIVRPTYLDFVDDISVLKFIMLTIICVILLSLVINIIFYLISILKDIPFIKKRIEKIESEKLGENTKPQEETNFVIKFILMCLLIVFVKFMLIPSLNLAGKFRNEFVLPNNLKNLDYLECSIKKMYSEPITSRILYLNDAYIFVETESDTEVTEIIILKFEDLLINKCK